VGTQATHKCNPSLSDVKAQIFQSLRNLQACSARIITVSLKAKVEKPNPYSLLNNALFKIPTYCLK
jgi:hypothetical protein